METKMGANQWRVGPDVVSMSDDFVIIIDAARDMPDWEVREFCRPAIYFRDRRYFVARRNRGKGKRMRYELQLWPEHWTETPPRTITYEEAYVRERETAARGESGAGLAHQALLPVYPLIGFLPSRCKAWLAEKLGVNAQSATRLSLALEVIGLLVHATYWSWSGGLVTLLVSHATGFRIAHWTVGPAAAHLAVILLFATDCIMRWDDLLRDAEHPDGLFEWVYRLLRRSNNG